MSNIAEGYGRDGSRDFLNFLSMAKGSAEEAKSQLYVALDLGYISEEKFGLLYGKAREISLMIFGLMSYIRKSTTKGTKFINK